MPAAEPAPASLPAKNSVVNFSILDKAVNEYKILVNGKVFSAMLPVNVKIGDSVLGIVLNNNPVVLNLVNILNIKSLNVENLAILLVKLGIPKTMNNLNLLKAFIINKKPIVKNNLSKMSEVLENLDFTFDENQLNYLVQVFLSEGNFKEFNEQTARYFRYSMNDIVAEIFFVMTGGAGKNEEVERICNAMSVNFNDEGFANIIAAEAGLRDKKIAEWITDNKENQDIEVQKLSALLRRYIVQKSFVCNEGTIPGFVIAVKDGRRELAEYKLEKTASEEGNLHYIINLAMRSAELGDIAVSGVLTKGTVALNFGMEANKKNCLEEEQEEFKKTLATKLGLSANISFNGTAGSEQKLRRYLQNGSINVRV